MYRVCTAPVVEDLGDLSTRLVGAVAAQAAGAEGEGHAVRALHRGHAAVAVGRAAAIVAQAHRVLDALLV